MSEDDTESANAGAILTRSPGPLAQLGERRLDKPEVTGSSPVRPIDSQRNVDVVRDLWNAYSRGDFDRVIALSDPYVVLVSLEEGPLYGSEALRANHARWLDAWDEDATATLDAVIGAGDHVLVIACFSGRGRSSGVRVEERLYEVYTLRNGWILRADEFTDREAAFTAAGLRA
jgi:ketosteroid isomerase-like protein